MHVPLELFRIMLDYVIINSKLEPIFKLRLVSQTFNTEILALVFRNSYWAPPNIDHIFHARYRYRREFHRRNLGTASVPANKNEWSSRWDEFPETLKPTYYYHRLQRQRKPRLTEGYDELVREFWPLLELSIGVSGLKEGERQDVEEVDKVFWELCEAVYVPGDGALLFNTETYEKSPISPRLRDPEELMRTFHLARLSRAIRRHDAEGARRALIKDVMLDRSSLCFGRQPLLAATTEGDVEVVAIMLTYGKWEHPRNRAKQIREATRMAVREQNEEMIKVLVEHPLGAIHDPNERILDKDSEAYWQKIVHEDEDGATRAGKEEPKKPRSLLRQCLEAAVKEAISLSYTSVLSFILHIHLPSIFLLYNFALVQAVKSDNAAMVAFILSTPIGGTIDLNTGPNGTPFLHYSLSRILRKRARHEIIALLLSRGADSNILSPYKKWQRDAPTLQTALGILNHQPGDRLKMFKMLVDSGAKDDLSGEKFQRAGYRLGLVGKYKKVGWVGEAVERCKKQMEGKETAGRCEEDIRGAERSEKTKEMVSDAGEIVEDRRYWLWVRDHERAERSKRKGE